MRGYWLQVRGADSPPAPLQERGIVTTGKRGLSIPEIAEHPLSPPGTGVSTTKWGGGGKVIGCSELSYPPRPSLSSLAVPASHWVVLPS